MHQHRSNTASTRNIQNDIVTAHAEVAHMFPRHEICIMQPHTSDHTHLTAKPTVAVAANVNTASFTAEYA